MSGEIEPVLRAVKRKAAEGSLAAPGFEGAFLARLADFAETQSKENASSVLEAIQCMALDKFGLSKNTKGQLNPKAAELFREHLKHHLSGSKISDAQVDALYQTVEDAAS